MGKGASKGISDMRLFHNTQVHLDRLSMRKIGCGTNKLEYTVYVMFRHGSGILGEVSACALCRCMVYLVYCTHGNDGYETTERCLSVADAMFQRRSCLFLCLRREPPARLVSLQREERRMRMVPSSTVLSLNILVERMLAARHMD